MGLKNSYFFIMQFFEIAIFFFFDNKEVIIYLMATKIDPTIFY